MRTVFTTEDVKNIAEQIFNGNLRASEMSKGKIEYVNPNSETVVLIDEETQEQTNIDLAKYFNIHFYNWKNRLVEERPIGENPTLTPFDTWVQSLNFSMNKAYALVEILDEEVVASQDIDSATIMGKITFIIQTDKINNLDYYVSKIRNSYLGVPQDIQNSYGDIIKAFIMVGSLAYDEEPTTMQLGECVIVSCGFRISYLANAMTYSDNIIQISFDGDDTYDSNGNIVGDTKYLTIPATKATIQNIFTNTPLPTAERPDLTGYISTALSMTKTITFFDFNKPLTQKFNNIFWRCGCYRYNGMIEQTRDVNIPIWIKIISGDNFYIYKDVVEKMEKTVVNNDFNVSSITTKGWGKIQ